MPIHRAVDVDNDLRGLTRYTATDDCGFAASPTLYYFRAQRGLVGHVSWKIQDLYVSLVPDYHDPLLGSAKQDKEDKKYKNGVAVTNLTPPCTDTVTNIFPIKVYNAKSANFSGDAKVGSKTYEIYSLPTGTLLNLESMKAYSSELIEKGPQVPYILHDAWWFDDKGKPTDHISRSNCIEMTVAVFVAGLYEREIPESFLAKHPAFQGTTELIQRRLRNGFSKRDAVSRIMRRPKMGIQYKWVRDVKGLIRDYIESRTRPNFK